MFICWLISPQVALFLAIPLILHGSNFNVAVQLCPELLTYIPLCHTVLLSSIALNQKQTPVLNLKPAPHLPSGYRVASDALSAQWPLYIAYFLYRTKTQVSTLPRNKCLIYRISFIAVKTQISYWCTNVLPNTAVCTSSHIIDAHSLLTTLLLPRGRPLYQCLDSFESALNLQFLLGLIRTRYFIAIELFLKDKRQVQPSTSRYQPFK